MRLRLKAAFVVVVFFTLTMSCSEEVNPEPYTYSRIFSGNGDYKTWKIQFIEVAVDDTVRSRFSEPCLSDNTFTFYASNERLYETTSGSSLCDQDEASLTSSNWSFVSANATLTMLFPIFSDGPLPFIVREADNNKFTAELFLDLENTQSYRIHFQLVNEE